MCPENSTCPQLDNFTSAELKDVRLIVANQAITFIKVIHIHNVSIENISKETMKQLICDLHVKGELKIPGTSNRYLNH